MTSKHSITFQIIGVGIAFFFLLPWIPNRGMGLYLALNPHDIAKLTLVLMTISLLGNTLITNTSGRSAFVISGLLGGFTSSTATIIGMARLTKEQPDIAKLASSAAIASNVATYFQLTLLIGMVSMDVLKQLILPILAGILTSLICCWLSYTPQTLQKTKFSPSPCFLQTLKKSLMIVLLLSAMMVCIAAAKERFGAQGIHFAALLSGVVDGHASAISISEMTKLHALSIKTALIAILLSLSSNSVSRVAFSALSLNKVFVTRVTGALTMTLMSSWLTLWLVHFA